MHLLEKGLELFRMTALMHAPRSLTRREGTMLLWRSGGIHSIDRGVHARLVLAVGEAACALR